MLLGADPKNTVLIGPGREKTYLWGFRQSDTQISLLSYKG